MSGFGDSTSPYSTTPSTNYGGTYDYGTDYGITTPTTQSGFSGVTNGYSTGMSDGLSAPRQGNLWTETLFPNEQDKSNLDKILEQQRLGRVENNLLEDGLDLLYGANRTVNGMTFGALDYLGNKLGVDTQMSDYLALKNNKGQAELVDVLGNVAEFGGGMLPSLYFGIPATSALTNNVVRWNGRRNLVNQLKRGKDFKDINFGKIDTQTLEKINQLRRQTGFSELTSNAYIPKNVVKKFYDKRLKENYTPLGISQMGKRLFHDKGSSVGSSKHPRIQEVMKKLDGKPDYGYISKNPQDGRTVIKSMYKK